MPAIIILSGLRTGPHRTVTAGVATGLGVGLGCPVSTAELLPFSRLSKHRKDSHGLSNSQLIMGISHSLFWA